MAPPFACLENSSLHLLQPLYQTLQTSLQSSSALQLHAQLHPELPTATAPYHMACPPPLMCLYAMMVCVNPCSHPTMDHSPSSHGQTSTSQSNSADVPTYLSTALSQHTVTRNTPATLPHQQVLLLVLLLPLPPLSLVSTLPLQDALLVLDVVSTFRRIFLDMCPRTLGGVV